MHVLIVLLNFLCTKPTTAVKLEYTKLLLGYIDCCCYLHAHVSSCMQYGNASSVHEAPAITTKHKHFSAFDYFQLSNVVVLCLCLLFDFSS